MTTTSMRSVSDEIAELRGEIQRLRDESSVGARKRNWRRPMTLVGIAVLTVGMLAGVAGASGNTTSVSFVSLSPAKTILSNVTIAAHKTNSPIVIGGSTTVPADATTVQLLVTAKGPSIGTLNFYPALNPSGGSGQTLAYPGSNVVATATIQENVGQSGELTFLNNGIGSAVVTAKIIGYSTQVTAGTINGVGGTAGQVLTNDGAGGASWQTQGQAYSSNGGNYVSFLSSTYPGTTIGSLTVPAGTYAVTASSEVQSFTSGTSVMAYCQLLSPANNLIQGNFTSTTGDAVTSQTGVVTTTGGTITEKCTGYNSGATAGVSNIVAIQVGQATGAVVNMAKVAPKPNSSGRFATK